MTSTSANTLPAIRTKIVATVAALCGLCATAAAEEAQKTPVPAARREPPSATLPGITITGRRQLPTAAINVNRVAPTVKLADVSKPGVDKMYVYQNGVHIRTFNI